jgi:hypothetical protein
VCASERAKSRAGVAEAEEANEKLGGFSVLSLLELKRRPFFSREAFCEHAGLFDRSQSFREM